MASSLRNLSTIDVQTMPSGAGMKIGIVVADWNETVTHALYRGCYDTLVEYGVLPADIETIQVPGSFELTCGARMLVHSMALDAVICLGCVIKGETAHNEYINHAVANGLTQLGIATGKPFIFGVLTPNDMEQALDRAGGKYGNKGVEAAVTALRMAHLRKELGSPRGKIGY